MWKRSFNAQTRHQLVDDDLLAAKSVAGVLMAVITVGLIGMIVVLLVS